jgi:hypothetical protein
MEKVVIGWVFFSLKIQEFRKLKNMFLYIELVAIIQRWVT